MCVREKDTHTQKQLERDSQLGRNRIQSHETSWNIRYTFVWTKDIEIHKYLVARNFRGKREKTLWGSKKELDGYIDK